MSYRWRRARLETECGAQADCRIQPGEPLCEQWVRCNPDTPGTKPLIRCGRHAHVPIPEDLPELDPVDDEALQLTPRQRRNSWPLPFDAKAAAARSDE